MELALYTALKTHILSELGSQLKGGVRLFNNQFENENVENAFLYPIVFLQFQPLEFRELSVGVQQFDMTVTTHLCFESYKDEDTDILNLKQSLYQTVNRFRGGDLNFSRLLRRAERPNYNHSNVQVYETDYFTTGKDFTTDTRPSTSVTPVDLDLSGQIVDINNL